MDKEPNLHNYADIVITKSQLSTGTIIDKDGLGNDPNGFIVHVNDGHLPQWNLRAESAREKKNWLSRLDNLLTIIKWVSRRINSNDCIILFYTITIFKKITLLVYSLYIYISPIYSWMTLKKCVCWVSEGPESCMKFVIKTPNEN